MKTLCRKALLALAALAATGAASAGVIEHADVAGFRTFEDTVTGRVWLDLDNFWAPDAQGEVTRPYSSYNAFLAAAQAAGFVWASDASVQALVSTLPFTPAPGGTSPEFTGYLAVMASYGGGEWDNLWGLAADAGSPTTQSFVFADPRVGFSWGSYQVSVNMSQTTGSGAPGLAFGGLWAYLDSVAPPPGAVPEPGTLALLVAGLLAGRAARRVNPPARA